MKRFSFLKNALMILTLTSWATGITVCQDINELDNIFHNQEEKIITEENRIVRSSDGVTYLDFNENHDFTDKEPKQAGLEYLSSIWDQLGHEESIINVLSDPTIDKLGKGIVMFFKQRHGNYFVENRGIKISINEESVIWMFQNTTIPISKGVENEMIISLNDAKNIVLSTFSDELYEISAIVNPVIIIKNDTERICSKFNVSAKDHTLNVIVYVDILSGELVGKKEFKCKFNGTGTVFKSNPTYSATTSYGTTNYVDNMDMTNADLDREMSSVDLIGLEYSNGSYKLSGKYASIIDPGGLYDQANMDFSYTRDNERFEAVMGYYHIDKTMRYVNEDLGINILPPGDGPVRYIPHADGEFVSYYNVEEPPHELGFVSRIFELAPGQWQEDVDDAEDAVIIIHELMHGLHDWKSGGIEPSFVASEGLADYLSSSEIKLCENVDQYREWEQGYHDMFHWGSMEFLLDQLNYNIDYFRVTNYDIIFKPSTNYESHIGGQYLATALMRILSDIGKEKTDLLVMQSLMNLGGSPSLQDAGAIIYATANQTLDQNSKCIVFNHLDDRLAIGGVVLNPPNGNDSDIYMKDTQCDIGEESNADDRFLWITDDIWVRNQKDGGLTHQNPVHNPSAPNWVYVRVRGRSCAELLGANLKLYFNRAGTGNVWPHHWVNFNIAGPFGSTIAGDEIPINGILPPIMPGEESIACFPWYPPPAPHFKQQSDFQHWRFLGRILHNNDPMNTIEGQNLSANVKNNNNIVCKSVSSLYYAPNNVVSEKIDLLLGCDFDVNGSKIELSTEPSSTLSILDLGNIYINLGPTMQAEYNNNELMVNGAQSLPDGSFKVTSLAFSIQGLQNNNCDQYMEVSFEPFYPQKRSSFYLTVKNNMDEYISSHRFEHFYAPTQEGSRTAKELVKEEAQKMIEIYPNPTSELTTISFTEKLSQDLSLYIMNAKGIMIGKYKSSDLQNSNTLELDVSQWASGVYMVTVISNKGKIVSWEKLVVE